MLRVKITNSKIIAGHQRGIGGAFKKDSVIVSYNGFH